MIKRISIYILSLQIAMLLMYFTTLLAVIDPPIYLLLIIWFLIGISGFAAAVVLIVKKLYLKLSIALISSSVIMFIIGSLMRLFVTM